jgi:hypothetical protein
MPRFFLSVLIALFLAAPFADAVAKEPAIGRWRVAVWPEYDDPGALVIYDGRFKDPSAFPSKSRFFLPKGVVVSDACSLSPEGQHFCQLFELEDAGEWDQVTLWLPFPNFYISFHLPPPDLKNPDRSLDYRILTNHDVEIMEVDIQEPLRATGFSVTPNDHDLEEVRKGYKHLRYSRKNLTPGSEQSFKISYNKTDPKPSVDIKYSRMSGEKVWGSPYGLQKTMGIMVYVVFGSGLLVVAIIAMALWKRRKKTS